MSGTDTLRIEYRFSLTGKRERHDWCIIGPLGAVNIWSEPDTSPHFNERWFGGIECHHAKAPEQAAYCGHHERCWLLGAECWHDGSSLQFAEQVEFRLPDPAGKPIGADTLDELSGILRSRYRGWLVEPLEEAETARGEVQ